MNILRTQKATALVLILFMGARGMISSVLDQAQKMFQKSNMTIKKTLYTCNKGDYLQRLSPLGKKKKLQQKWFGGLVCDQHLLLFLVSSNFFYQLKWP